MPKEFPLLPFEKLAKSAGVERVAESASNELREAFADLAHKLAIQAVAACHHAHRVTVKRDDINMAVRIIFK